MVIEQRRLIFTKEEVIQAITMYSQKMGKVLPLEDFKDIEYQNGDDISVAFHFRKTEPEFFDIPEIAAALITLCRDKNIPLPRKAHKSLKLKGDHIVMTVVRA